MQLILLERVEGLGNVGDEVTVRSGYGRNFLIPQGKASLANAGNRKVFERQRAQLEAKQSDVLSLAEAEAKKLAGLSFEVVLATSDGTHLYGSVGTTELAELLVNACYQRNAVQVNGPVPSNRLSICTDASRCISEQDRLADVRLASPHDERRVRGSVGRTTCANIPNCWGLCLAALIGKPHRD